MEKVTCVRCGKKIVYPPANVCTLCLLTTGPLQKDER